MKTKQDNRIVVDLCKVQWARFYYRNQYGNKRDTLPILTELEFSIRNATFNRIEEPELYAQAMRKVAIDIWEPRVYLKLTANAALIYCGDKALSIWKKWQEMQFKPGSKTKAKRKLPIVKAIGKPITPEQLELGDKL